MSVVMGSLLEMTEKSHCLEFSQTWCLIQSPEKSRVVKHLIKKICAEMGLSH